MTERQDPYMPFYSWLILTGLMLIGVFLLWRYQLLVLVIDADQTRLSLAIMILFAFVCIYLGVAAWRLSRQNQILGSLLNGETDISSFNKRKNKFIYEHLLLAQTIDDKDNGYKEALYMSLVGKIHRGHSLGWFAVDVFIRMGLIGTVLGFILMLGTVYQLQNDDISALKNLLGSMGSGMQVALYTTLTGISVSLILSVYCKILDYFAENLAGETIKQLINSPPRVLVPQEGL